MGRTKKIKAVEARDDLMALGAGTGSIRFAEKRSTIIVPTILPGFNRAGRCGGAPTSCMAVIHGPSKGGKTAFCLALVRSFQLCGHLTVYVDAEHTLEPDFVSSCEVDASKMLLVEPETYEETVKEAEIILGNYRKLIKEKGNQDRCLLVIIDSINKLVPKSELDKLGEVQKGYPIRALMNSMWMDKLTPIVGKLPILFVVLAHEKMKLDATPYEQKWRIKGGSSLVYDATMAIRIQQVKPKTRVVNGKKVIVGHVHEGKIEKNKVGVSSERFRFVMGQGRLGYPLGFDYCEQIIEEAILRGGDSPIVRRPGGVWRHHALPDGTLKGDSTLVDHLRENPELVSLLIREMDETSINAIVSADEDTEQENEEKDE